MFIFHFWALDTLLCGHFLIFYLFWKAYEIINQLMYFLLCWQQYIVCKPTMRQQMVYTHGLNILSLKPAKDIRPITIRDLTTAHLAI